MSRIKKSYRVADHVFSIVMDESSMLWEKSAQSYGPFEVPVEDGIFTLSVEDALDPGISQLVYTNKETVEIGFIVLSVYKSEKGHYFEFTQPGAARLSGALLVSDDLSDAKVTLNCEGLEKWNTFNTAMDFCFLLATACRGTLLTHSSSIVYDGRAYIFLGKSGTGKSTHSRMWLKAIEGTVLMNDDHPVVRVHDDGRVIAYGSPWSGKTPCYKNMSAPLGGVIRISRAPYNKARRLSPIESYASLMTSCSGMTWERQLADGKDATLQNVIKSVPCWVMECLPDEDAGRTCCEAVTGVYKVK